MAGNQSTALATFVRPAPASGMGARVAAMLRGATPFIKATGAMTVVGALGQLALSGVAALLTSGDAESAAEAAVKEGIAAGYIDPAHAEKIHYALAAALNGVNADSDEDDIGLDELIGGLNAITNCFPALRHESLDSLRALAKGFIALSTADDETWGRFVGLVRAAR